MAEFVQRTTAPTEDNAYYYAKNPFYKAGYGLPNCTCYAWGRFWEIMGGDTKPSLSTGNAENWWGKTSDGYARGSTPKLGAVICWRKGAAGVGSDGAGHVAVVEKINEDGSIVTSESGWGSSSLFWRKTRKNDGNWGSSSSYTFQGFIYNPIDFEAEDLVAKEDVVSANRYLTEEEMQLNARYIWQYLSAKGWTLNAVAGMLGNMENESTINPGIWQNLNEGVGPAYGLVQWDPYTKYMTWCEENGLDPADMDSALQRIEYELENGLQYYKNKYPYTFAEFKVSTDSAYTLACAFAFDYERSHTALYGTEEEKAALRQLRGNDAVKWYNYLANYAGVDTTTGKWHPTNKKGLNLLLLVAASRRRL